MVPSTSRRDGIVGHTFCLTENEVGPPMSTAIVDGKDVPDGALPSSSFRRHVDGNGPCRRHDDGIVVKMTTGEVPIVLVSPTKPSTAFLSLQTCAWIPP